MQGKQQVKSNGKVTQMSTNFSLKIGSSFAPGYTY